MIAFLAALIEDRRLALWATGAIAIVAGSVAPWVHVASPLRPLTELGLDADGKVTVLCGVASLGLVAAYARLRGRDLAAGAAICAAVSGSLSILYVVRVKQASSRVLARMLDVDAGIVRPDFGARAGLGVWVVAAASVAVLVATAAVVVRSHPAQSGSEPGREVTGEAV